MVGLSLIHILFFLESWWSWCKCRTSCELKHPSSSASDLRHTRNFNPSTTISFYISKNILSLKWPNKTNKAINRPQTSTTNGTNTVNTTIIHHWMLAAKHMCVKFHSQESRFIEAAGTLHRVGGRQTDDFLSPLCRKIHWNYRLFVVGGGVKKVPKLFCAPWTRFPGCLYQATKCGTIQAFYPHAHPTPENLNFFSVRGSGWKKEEKSTEELVQEEVIWASFDLSSAWDGVFPLSLLEYSQAPLAGHSKGICDRKPHCTPPHFIEEDMRRP